MRFQELLESAAALKSQKATQRYYTQRQYQTTINGEMILSVGKSNNNKITRIKDVQRDNISTVTSFLAAFQSIHD